MKPIVVETTVTIDDQKLKTMIARLKEADEQYPEFFLFAGLQDDDDMTAAMELVDKLQAAGIEAVPAGADEDADLLKSFYDHLNHRIDVYNEAQEDDDEDDEEDDDEGEEEETDEEEDDEEEE